MRKLILSMMVSLDGRYEGPGEGWEKIDWHLVDEEWDAYSTELMGGADTLLFGRTTYEGFAQFWPTQQGEVARMLSAMEKVVFSSTLAEASWAGSRLVRGDAAEEIARLKAAPGNDILIFGSGTLVQSLAERGLIDEYRLAFNPVVLGSGTPLFREGMPRLNLRLVGVRQFAIGVIELRYAPARA